MSEIMIQIEEAVKNGKAKQIKELVPQAMEAGLDASQILDALLAGMAVIGDRFTKGEVFVPEVLVSARAMNKGTELIRPMLAESGAQPIGKACIGTVKGDLHDIGKNLVKLMLEAKNIEVVDLGTDVAPETFVRAAKEENCRIVCCSALLTTTMPVMGDVVKALEGEGIRESVKVFVGGAPVNQSFCDAIGADVYTENAALAAQRAQEIFVEG